jgi:phenylpropionate dioxygenase-like ring-hydroxylating dioxygenase large terminal subunit
MSDVLATKKNDLIANQWYAVARSSDVKRKPVRIVLNNVPYVLFRNDDSLSCLHDICPHRFARLSSGKIIDGTIQCPYHGWQFNGKGHCTFIPVHSGELPKRYVRALSVREVAGLIFVCQSPEEGIEPYSPTWDGRPMVRSILKNETRTNLVNVAENVLDPTHTLFVHKGIMRGLSDKRSAVDISVTRSMGRTGQRVDVRFDGEETQNGWLSRLLEGKRSRSTGMFIMPGVVELEYWSGDQLSLVTTLYFTPISEFHQLGFAVLTGPRKGGLGYFKKMLFVPAMRHIINQDRIMMDEAQSNWETNGKPMRAMSPTDFIRPSIESILAGKRFSKDNEKTTFRFML